MTMPDVRYKKGDKVVALETHPGNRIIKGKVYTVMRDFPKNPLERLLFIRDDDGDEAVVFWYRFERFLEGDPFKDLEDALQRCIQKSEDNIKQLQTMRECLTSLTS